MSITPKEFRERAERWQKHEPEELAKNFHALVELPRSDQGPGNFQFLKATSFPIAGFEKLRDLDGDITQIKIWMTMKEFDKEAIGFQPILEVFYKDPGEVEHTLLLGGDGNNVILGDTEPVPLPFVENTTQLWRDLESENLPGVFEARGKTGQAERVQYYVVAGEGLKIMNLLFPNMSGMSILPGLDLNKSVDSGNTIFIPIVQIKAPLKIIEFSGGQKNHLTGFHWMLNEGDGDDDNYFDYTRPCPPFCGE